MSTTTGQGLVRNPSIRSSRPIRKAPVRRTSTSNDMDADDDAKAANAQLIADLKEQVERAEQASEHYRRQLDAMQKRLDEVANETIAAEERELQFRTQVDKLQAELRDNVRQTRELEISHGSDKKSLLDDRAKRSQKETELQAVISRLTENLRLKTQELNSTNRRGIETHSKLSFRLLTVVQAPPSVTPSKNENQSKNPLAGKTTYVHYKKKMMPSRI